MRRLVKEFTLQLPEALEIGNNANLTASKKFKEFAATKAVYSPRLWPAIQIGEKSTSFERTL